MAKPITSSFLNPFLAHTSAFTTEIAPKFKTPYDSFALIDIYTVRQGIAKRVY